ncbi:MAG: transposase [Acidobacteria bacterium]|nr:transposase [Acidobacteriota bacterium]
MCAQIRVFHDRSDRTYGAPRIHRDLRDAAERVGRKRVARLLKAEGLQGVSRRKWPHTTRRDPRARPAPDLVNRALRRRRPTTSGSPISPPSPRTPGCSIWPWCLMSGVAGSSGGRWRRTCARVWCWRR